jgi:hypothetical protein
MRAIIPRPQVAILTIKMQAVRNKMWLSNYPALHANARPSAH